MKDKTSWAMNDMALVRLLLRAGPFALARRDIDVSPLPDGQAVGAYYTISEKKGGRPFMLDSYRVDTIGGLVRMWENFVSPDCPDCGRPMSIVAFGGSFLSGAGKFSKWFCPSCGKDFKENPPCGVVQLGEALVDASRRPAIVRPPATDQASILPKGLTPADLGGVFGGDLLKSYVKCAVDALAALDAEAAAAVAAKRTFPATFALDVGGGVEGEISFSNVAGFGHLFTGGGDRPVAAIPIEWDEQFGLWPTIYAAAGKLAELRKAEKKTRGAAKNKPPKG